MSRLVAAFSRIHSTAPERPLLHVPAAGRSLTAADVWRMHRTYAGSLRDHGLAAGQLLVAAVGNRPALVPLLLGARACGMAVAAVDIGTTAAEIDDVARRFGAATIALPVGAAGDIDGERASLADDLELVTPRGVRAADHGGAALLKLTSGSTGVPKAAATTDDHLIEDSRHIVAAMGIAPDDTQMAVIPLSHAYGVSVILVPLLIQGTAIVLRESFVPHQLPDDARTFGATTFAGVPYMFDYFVANPPPAGWPLGLHRLISAGARLTPETVRGFFDRFGVKIHSFYGTSESGGISYDAASDVDGSDTVGWPLPGVTVTCRPDEQTPPGAGRVHVASGAVAAGYVGQSSDDFVDGGFLTGDYGAFDDRGRLALTGRVSSFINVAGRKVQPSEIEDVLRQMPGVRDVRVLGAPDPQRGEQVVACLVAAGHDAEAVSTLAVRRFCSSRLAPHKIPRTVIVLDAIPLTARGKTDGRALAQRVRATIEGIPEQMC